jgi:hypothetical protein
MIDRLDEASDERIKVLGEIERDKLRIDRAYNKRVKEKSFQVEDLLWKMILPQKRQVREVVTKLGRAL